MEALDDELLQQADERLSLTQKLRLVWTQPKRVFTAVVTSNQDFESFLLLFVTAVLVGFNKSKTVWYYFSRQEEYLNVLEILRNTAVFIGIYYCMIVLIRWTGSWLGGKAGFRPLAAVYAFSNTPVLFFIIVLGVEYIGWAYLYSDAGHYEVEFPPWYETLSTVILYLKYGVNIFTLVFHVISIAVVQQFGYFRALLNLLLAMFMLIVPLFMISYLGWLDFILR